MSLTRDHRTKIHSAAERKIWIQELRITTTAPFPQGHAVSSWRNLKPGSVHDWRIYIMASEYTRGMVRHDLRWTRYSVLGEAGVWGSYWNLPGPTLELCWIKETWPVEGCILAGSRPVRSVSFPTRGWASTMKKEIKIKPNKIFSGKLRN